MCNLCAAIHSTFTQLVLHWHRHPTALVPASTMTCAALHTPCTATHQYPCLVMVAHPKFHHESNYLLGEVQVPQHVVFLGETFLLKIGQVCHELMVALTFFKISLATPSLSLGPAFLAENSGTLPSWRSSLHACAARCLSMCRCISTTCTL